MISAYVKAVVKQREIKELVAVSCIFFVRSNFKTWNTMYHQASIFHLILLGTSFSLALSIKNREVGRFLLNRQNSLSVTKVICRQSLSKVNFLLALLLTFSTWKSNLKLLSIRAKIKKIGKNPEKIGENHAWTVFWCYVFVLWQVLLRYGCWKSIKIQKQPSRVVTKKKCSENMQHIYRRTPIPKCDFNKVATYPTVVLTVSLDSRSETLNEQDIKT